jgi:hypothetical protein
MKGAPGTEHLTTHKTLVQAGGQSRAVSWGIPALKIIDLCRGISFLLLL